MSETNSKDLNKLKDHWKPNPKQAEFLAIPHSIKEAAYLGGAGSGKLLTLNTLVLCPEGFKEIQYIHKGDYVIGKDGLPKLVIAETEHHFDEQLYKLTFENGEIVYCGSNHLWTTWNMKDRHSKTESARDQRSSTRWSPYTGKRPDMVEIGKRNRAKPYKGRVRDTQELFETKLDRRGGPNHAIEICKPVQLEEKKLPIPPYILGCWLGDGTSVNGNMTIGQEDFMSFMFHFMDYGFKLIPNASTGTSFRAEGLQELLKQNNLIDNKHIPEIYFLGSESQRRELLQGLLDTDGHCYSTGQVEFCNTNINLVEGVFKLVSSLGIKCNTTNAWHSGNPNHKQAYHVKWINPYPVFKLTRKLEKLPKELSTKSRFHYITNIEKVENQLGKCIQVVDKEYLITKSCIPTHNSDVLLMYGILNRWHENPQWKQVFMRRTFPELKNEILGRAREIYSKFGATFNKTDMIWTFPRLDQYGSGGLMGNSGAQIFLGHCEHEDDVHKYDSMQIPLFTPDEITSFTANIYNYITFERNRSPQGTGLPSITRCAGMPGGIGHTWVKKRFIDPHKDGGKIIIGKGNNKRIYIHATYVDNKEHIDPTYGQSLDGRPEAERKAKKFGDFDAYLGQVFDEFRDVKYPDEPEHALHCIEPFEIPDFWPRFVIIDWGFRANTWVGYFAVSPNKRLYLYKELVWNKTKIAEWGPIAAMFIDEKTRFIKVCKSAGQDRGQDHTIQGEIERELGRPVELTLNSPGSRIAGKMLLHEYLRWTPKPQPKVSEKPVYNEEYALRIFRMSGQEAYENYLALFNDPPIETNLPKYQIFLCKKSNHDECVNCCPNAVEAIKSCNYAESTKGDKPAEDVAEFHGDDAYDGQRYGIDAAEQLFTEAAEEFEKYQKQSELEAKLLKDRNWTAFYRMAEKINPSTRPLIVAKTFHRRMH